MIYIFEMGQYEDRETKAVFEGPAGMRLGMEAFLESLGLPPPPDLPREEIQAASPDGQRVLVQAYETDRRAWQDERAALLKAKAIYKQEDLAHLAWLREQPDLRELNEESEFELI